MMPTTSPTRAAADTAASTFALTLRSSNERRPARVAETGSDRASALMWLSVGCRGLFTPLLRKILGRAACIGKVGTAGTNGVPGHSQVQGGQPTDHGHHHDDQHDADETGAAPERGAGAEAGADD